MGFRIPRFSVAQLLLVMALISVMSFICAPAIKMIPAAFATIAGIDYRSWLFGPGVLLYLGSTFFWMDGYVGPWLDSHVYPPGVPRKPPVDTFLSSDWDGGVGLGSGLFGLIVICFCAYHCLRASGQMIQYAMSERRYQRASYWYWALALVPLPRILYQVIVNFDLQGLGYGLLFSVSYLPYIRDITIPNMDNNFWGMMGTLFGAVVQFLGGVLLTVFLYDVFAKLAPNDKSKCL